MNFISDAHFLADTNLVFVDVQRELIMTGNVTPRLTFVSVNPTKSTTEVYTKGIIELPEGVFKLKPMHMVEMAKTFVEKSHTIPVFVIHITSAWITPPTNEIPAKPLTELDNKSDAIAVSASTIDGRAAYGLIYYDKMENGAFQIIVDDTIFPTDIVKARASIEEMMEDTQKAMLEENTSPRVRGMYDKYILEFFSGVERAALSELADFDRFLEEE